MKRKKKKIRKFWIFIVLLLICMIMYSFNKENGIIDNLLEDNNSENQVETKEYETNVNIGLVNVDTFNPILTKNNDVINFMNLIYDSLFYYDSEMKLVSNIVDEYNYNANTLFIRIKKDILWSNGSEFTVNDINFTIEKIKEFGGIYASSVSNISSVEIVDNWNIKFNLLENNNLEHYKLVFPILNQKHYENENFEITQRNEMPVGTGVYRFAEKLNDNEYIYKVNAFAKNQNEKIEQITIKKYSTIGEAFANLKTNKNDIINTGLTNYEDYVGTIGYGKTEYINNSFMCIGINKSNQYLSNTTLRKAINEIIDKQTIWQNVYNSKGVVTQSSIYPDSYLYQNEGYIYSVDTAKQTLVNSGVSGNIVVNLVIKNNDENIMIANLIKENLTKLNISLNIVSVDNNEYTERLSNKNYDLILVQFDIPRIIDLNMYTTDQYYGLFNLNNEQINNMVKNITDDNSIKDTAIEIQKLISNDIPFIGIGFKKSTVLTNNNLVGLAKINYTNIYYDMVNAYKKK